MSGPDKHIDEPGAWDDHGNPTRTVAEIIIEQARLGLPAEIAAQYAGISYKTYRRWISEGRTVLRRLADEPDSAFTPQQRRCAEFATDVAAAQAAWIADANQIMQDAASAPRRKVRTKITYEPGDGPDGLVETQRQVTIIEEPVDLAPLQWRMAKLYPQVYGTLARYEQDLDDGGVEEIDIAKRVDELMARVAETLTIAPDDETEELGTALAR